MKIHRLDLRAIGPFTGEVLDLSGGAEGLHLIYGDNERGKTSALRALGDMFFGIPQTSPADFVHRYEKMRVGALIAGRNGQRLEFLRRKGKKDTLLAADDKTPIDESELRTFIGGCDRPQFEQMFGIDHKSLVDGGQAIVRGQGEVGQVLFAAGAGIADLRSIAATLTKDADDRFKPSGSKPRINELLSKLKETTKLIRESQLPSSRWAEHKKAKESAESELRRIDDHYQQAMQQQGRLQRIRRALPVVAHWKQLQEQLAVHADTPRLSPDFAKCRGDTAASLDASRKALAGIDEEIARIDRELAGHRPPESLLLHVKQIEQQHERLGEYRKAERDRRALAMNETAERAVARQILNDLRPELDIADAASLRLSKQQKANIQTLARQHEALRQEAKSAQEEIDSNENRGAELAIGNEPLLVSRDVAALADTIAAARSEGQLERQAGKLKAEIAKTQKQIEIECSNLGLVAGDLESVEKLPAPGMETLESYDRIFAAHDEEITAAREATKRAQADQGAIERHLGQLGSGELPTEADLAESRELRDRGWQLVLADWQRQRRDADGELQFLDALGHAGPLAEAFERSFHRADELVDLLRHESKRVAARDLKAVELAEAKERNESCSLQLAKLLDERRRSEIDWRQCWQAAGIEPRTPREMKDWLLRRQSIVKLGQSQRDLLADLAECETWIAKQRQLLLQQLTCFGEPPASAASLQELLITAQVTLNRLEEDAKARRKSALEREQIERNLLAARKKATQAEQGLSSWQSQWAASITPLGLGVDASSEQVADFVLQCDELIDHLIKADQIKGRIEAIEVDGQQFRKEVERLNLAIDSGAIDRGSDRAELEHERAVDDLFARLQQALADKQAIERLQAERRRQAEKREVTKRDIDKLQARLDAYCREAGCKLPEELPAIEQCAAAAADLRRQFDIRENDLLQLGNGASIAEIVAEVDAVAKDDIESEFARLERDVGELQAKRNELHQTIGGEKKALDSMDTSAAAADAAQDEQEILARLETEVAQYLRLRLASAVLDEGIERYRKKNEGPVLSRASALFARLTVGSFEGLAIDLEKQQIVGVRGEDRIGPEAMSEGSCDQLYLALRLASLETWIESHEPLPFIVDDILVSFDDRRSAAALEVLAEVSKKTQVIFFAHHRHLVEIAEKSVAKSALFVHEL